MSYIFEPAVRLMNRMKYAYKFGIIGLLIVLQASVLIYMLVSELNKNVDFAMRERVGVQYVEALTHLLTEAQVYRNLHYEFLLGNRSVRGDLISQEAKVDAALAAVEVIDKQAAGQMDTTWKLQMLQQDWLARKQETVQSEAGRALVVFDLDSRWLTEVIDVMQHVGYESNLAMDSDYDTSYLVDSVLRKLPELVNTVGIAEGLSIQLYDENHLPDRNRLLQVVGLMHSYLEQADHNVQLVFRHNEAIKTQLRTLNGTLSEAVPIFAWNVEQKTVGQQGLPISRQFLAATGSKASESAQALQQEEIKAIDQLLMMRINKYLQYRNSVILFTGAILLLVCYLFLGFDMSVRRAVYQLNRIMLSAGKGDWNVRGAVYSRDEMGSLTQAINNTLDSLQQMYNEVQLSHSKLAEWNQELECKVAERTLSLKNLLDHAGQGFLSFGENFRVSKEYSAECAVIFHCNIAGEKVSALIYPEDREQQAFLEAVFRKILCEPKNSLRETYISLLPEEIVISNSWIGVNYKIIDDMADQSQRKIMMILTDRTLQKAMEERVQAERNMLDMIVHVVTHSSDFFAAISQYTSFCQDGLSSLLLKTKGAEAAFATVFRTVHTFKGTFGQLRMGHVMAKLHEMEGRLDVLRSQGIADLDNQQLLEKLNGYTTKVMLGWLDADLTILKEKLGEEFFQRENMLVVDNERLLEIEKKVQSMLSSAECSLLLPDLRRLRYKPIKELLQSYPEYVLALAERNEKAIYSFEVEGGETRVDPEKYNDFIKSLGHVFRNSLVHGVESFAERIEQGKDDRGKITCSVGESQNGFTIIISDDGRGMEVDHIREVALEKGICTLEETVAMGEKEIFQLIFADGFSGAKEVDELAGRGVGLSAVQEEVVKLGGTIQVHTQPGKGTRFEFFLPLAQPEEVEPYQVRQLGNPLARAAESRLQRDTGLPLNRHIYLDNQPGGKLKLRKVTAFLGIKGIINGRMVLSADQAVVEHLLQQSFSERDIDLPLDRRMENVLSQYASEIFQQAIKSLPDLANSVTAEALVSILAEDASAKYPQAETPTWVFTTDYGTITLSLIC